MKAKKKATGKVVVRELNDYGPHRVVSEIATLDKEYLDGLIVDNEWRVKLRVMLPTLIGKIKVKNHRFQVYNRMGKLIFESESYGSLRNSSEAWKQKVRDGIKKYWAERNGK